MPYRNNDLKNTLLPTLDQVQKYVKAANNDDAKYRDVRKLMSFLQRLPQADRHLTGLMQARKLAVLGFDYTIKYPDDIPVPDSELNKLNEMKLRFRVGNIQKTFTTLMNGVLFGVSASRLLWTNHPVHKTMVEKITHLDITDLDYNLESTDLLDELETTKNGNFTRTLLDPETHIFMRYNPLEGIINDFPGSFMRTNMIYVLLKYWDYFNWAQANEKFSDALVVALYDPKAKTEDIEAVKDGLRNLGSAGKAAFSKDIEIKFLEAVRQGITDMHKEFISMVNTEMSISILGQSLTTDISKVGSFAAAKVHNLVRQDILWSDILTFQNVLTEQYIKKDYLMNYGEPRDAFPVFEFNTDEIEDYESNARIIAEYKSAGIPILKSEAYKKVNLTEPAEGEEII